MTKLIFITHPSVAVSKDVPIDEWPLSEKGLRETETLLGLPFWVEVDHIYTSTEPKAFTVAELLKARTGKDFTKVENLKEVDRSATGPVPYPEYMGVVQEFYANPSTHVRGWESADDARKRIKEAVRHIMERHAGETIVIVGHGATGTLLACEIKGIESTFAEDPKRTACFMEIDWESQRILTPWQAYGETASEAQREQEHARLK